MTQVARPTPAPLPDAPKSDWRHGNAPAMIQGTVTDLEDGATVTVYDEFGGFLARGSVANGEFTINFNMLMGPHTFTVTATGINEDSGNSDSATTTTELNATYDPTPGLTAQVDNVGDLVNGNAPVDIFGTVTNLDDGSTVTIKEDGQTIATVYTSNNQFATTVDLAPGQHTLIVSVWGINTVTGTAATAPPAPVTLDVYVPESHFLHAEPDNFDDSSRGPDGVYTGNLLINDTLDGNPVGNLAVASLISGLNVKHGTVVINSDGTFFYTPDGTGYTGDDSFGYLLTDATDNLTDQATVTINVNGLGNAPTAADQTYTTMQLKDGAIAQGADPAGAKINLLKGASDDQTPVNQLTVKNLTKPQNGVLQELSNGVYRYLPKNDFQGQDSFTFQLFDGTNLSKTATVSVTVQQDPSLANLTPNEYYDSNGNQIFSPGAQWHLGTTPPPLNVDKDPGASGNPALIANPSAGWESQVGTTADFAFQALVISVLDDPSSQQAINMVLQLAKSINKGPGPLSWSPESIAMMAHYMDNTGTPININVANMLNSSPSSLKNYQDSMGWALIYASNMKFLGTVNLTETAAHLGDTTDSPDWWIAVGQYTGWGAMTVSTTLGASGKLHYTLSYTYNVWDPYDWDPTKPGINGVIQKELATLHLDGLAQQYLATGSMTKTVEWNEGDPLPNVPDP